MSVKFLSLSIKTTLTDIICIYDYRHVVGHETEESEIHSSAQDEEHVKTRYLLLNLLLFLFVFVCVCVFCQCSY